MAGIKGEKVNSDNMPQRRPSRSKVYRSRMRLIFTCLLLLAIVVAAVLVAVFAFFKVSVVNVSGSKIYSEEEILEKSGISTGDNLVLEDSSGAEERLKSELPYIENVKITKKIPSTINIEVTDAEVYYSFQSGSNYLYISRYRKLLETAASPMDGSILVTGAEVSEENGRIKFKDSNAEAVFEEIAAVFAENEKGEVSAIDISDLYNINITYAGRIVMKLGGNSDLEYKINFGLRVVSGELESSETGTLDLSLARDANKAYFAPDVSSSIASQSSDSSEGSKGDSFADSSDSEGGEGTESSDSGESTEESTESSDESSTSSSLRGNDIPDTPLSP